MSRALKRQHAWHTPAEVDAARRRARETRVGQEYLANLRGDVQHLLGLSWDELWDSVPPIDLPRTTFLNSDLLDRTAKSGEECGCPIHGPEIFRRQGGNRAWLVSPKHPWKVQCPLGREFYPTNDFGAYLAGGRRERLDTRQEYVDDGTGYVDDRGRRYFFIAYYNQQCRWAHEVIWAARVFGRLYLLTEEPDYARRGAILLLRTAAAYPVANYGSQTYPPGTTGKIFMWCEDYYATAGPIGEAYDDLFTYLRDGQDAEFFEFLRRQGVTDPCFFVEHNFIQNLYHTGALTEELIANPGYLEEALSAGLAALGPVQAAPHTSNLAERMTEFVLHGGHYHGLHGLLWGNLWHDGLPGSNLGYNTGIAGAILLVLERLAVAGTNLWHEPRARLLAESIAAYSLGGMFCPSTGDGGGCKGWTPFGRDTFRAAIRAAYRGTREPRLIAAFHAVREYASDPWRLPILHDRPYAIRNLEPELFDNDLEETSERPRPERQACFVTGTRHFPGHGVAFLESGGPDSPRALSLTYGGTAAGHHHLDRLNVELAWRNRVLLPDLGYPEAWLDKYRKWSRNTLSHYGVMVDRQPQRGMGQGALLLLGDAGPVHAVEAENLSAYAVLGVRDYRRTAILVDLGHEGFYLFDVFRVKGGNTHHWSFHGPAAAGMSVAGVAVPEPRPGTLMDEAIAFGAITDDESGLQYLAHVRPLAPAADFSVQWRHEDGLACVRATVLTDRANRYFLCDGQPERGTCEARWLQYLVAERTGADLASAFPVVVDAWADGGMPLVTGVTRLHCAEPDVVAVQVVHADGTDTIVSAPGAHREVEVGALRLTGRLGFVRESRDGSICLALLDGTRLQYQDRELVAPLAQGEVVAIDLDANRVALAGRHHGIEPGRVVRFRRGSRQSSFTIRAVEAGEDRTWLTLKEQIIALCGHTEYWAPETARLYTRMLATKYGTGHIHTDRFNPDLTDLCVASGDGRWSAPIAGCRLCPLERKSDAGYVPVAERHLQLAAGTAVPEAVSRHASQFWILEVAPGSLAHVPGVAVARGNGAPSP